MNIYVLVQQNSDSDCFTKLNALAVEGRKIIPIYQKQVAVNIPTIHKPCTFWSLNEIKHDHITDIVVYNNTCAEREMLINTLTKDETCGGLYWDVEVTADALGMWHTLVPLLGQKNVPVWLSANAHTFYKEISPRYRGVVSMEPAEANNLLN